jgi:predicted nucleotide-binding protein
VRLDQGPLTLGRGGPYDDRHEAIPYVSEGKACALTLLREAVRGLEEEIEFATPDIDSAVVLTPNQQPSRKVFIVHGHDEGARETVARFLERIGFEAIILHEQANQGRTVIEKVVAHGDVGFAVVLLTPDDEGCKKGEAVKPRARQNVVLELGYFVGRLGRERVCALKRGDVELPSDFGGVIYEPFDEGGGWRQALGRELQAAGFAIDWNVVMRP